jgi:hypothetical protein
MSDFYKEHDSGDMPTKSLHVPGMTPGAPGGTAPGRRRWSRGKQAAVLLATCAVVGGGAFTAVQAATGSTSAPAASTQAAAAQTGTQAGQAGSQAGSATTATTQAAILRDAVTGTGVRRLARLRLLGGLYGQFTYETKQGARSLAFERGTITSVSGSNVVVRATDGTTWTWTLTGTSVVREDGTKEAATALAQGETVFAGGPVTNGVRDARLIVIRKAKASASSSSASSSSAASA